MNRFKTFALAATAAGALSLAATPQAEARPRHGGAGLAALAVGLIVGGAVAAASRARAAEDIRECFVTRRWVDTPYGPERRTIRVCE